MIFSLYKAEYALTKCVILSLVSLPKPSADATLNSCNTVIEVHILAAKRILALW